MSALPTAAWWAARAYRRFENAHKTRNRCAHVNQGEPTRQEVKQSIELAGLLRRFVQTDKRDAIISVTLCATKQSRAVYPYRHKYLKRLVGAQGFEPWTR